MMLFKNYLLLFTSCQKTWKAIQLNSTIKNTKSKYSFKQWIIPKQSKTIQMIKISITNQDIEQVEYLKTLISVLFLYMAFSKM